MPMYSFFLKEGPLEKFKALDLAKRKILVIMSPFKKTKFELIIFLKDFEKKIQSRKFTS